MTLTLTLPCMRGKEGREEAKSASGSGQERSEARGGDVSSHRERCFWTEEPTSKCCPEAGTEKDLERGLQVTWLGQGEQSGAGSHCVCCGLCGVFTLWLELPWPPVFFCSLLVGVLRVITLHGFGKSASCPEVGPIHL